MFHFKWTAYSTSDENEVELSPAIQGLHAELIETLHKVVRNQSFASATISGDRFQLMFPNQPASEQYHCSSTKKELICCATLQTEVLFEEIKNDIIDDPYTVRFDEDESNTNQVKKKLDIYDYYWSKIYDQVVNG